MLTRAHQAGFAALGENSITEMSLVGYSAEFKEGAREGDTVNVPLEATEGVWPGDRAFCAYFVSDQWPVASYCEDATWCALSGIVMEGDTPRLRNGYPDSRMFLSAPQTWRLFPPGKEAAAMRGTGSNQVRVHDVFVPEEFAHSPTKPLLIDRPAYRLSYVLLFAPMGAVLACGVLRTALDSAVEALSSKVSTFSGKILREQAPIQELIARSYAALRAARLDFITAMNAVWEIARTGADVPLKLKAEVYASSFYALDLVREAISRLYAEGTRDAFLQGNPVERALRNIHAIVFGLQSARPFYEAAGRVYLGGEPQLPVF
jgi:alkylation response protein AidB-like acyl-CoA dehydrogenase